MNADADKDCAQVHVTEIAIRLDFKLDESYTPNRLSIRAGTSFHDLREIKIVTLNQVNGWVMITLEPPEHPIAHLLLVRQKSCQAHPSKCCTAAQIQSPS